MSKAFTVGANFLGGAMRSTTSDLNPGGAANTLVGDQTSGAREGIVGDPTSNAESAHSTGTLSGTLFNHYSLLRTTEELLGLPLLGQAASAASMRPAFGL